MLSSILNLGLVAAVFLQLATATDHTVGSPAGTWDLATDLQTWASSTNFFAGDTLTFQYPASHNVLEVSKTDFESCTTSNPLTEDASGNTVVLLKAAGKRYFICGMAGHCSFGMKMEVIVNPTNPPPPSSPPPSFSAPSKPPRSFSTPSKPPPFVPKPPSFSAPSNPPPSFKAPKPPSLSAPSNPPPSFKSPKPPSFSAPSNPPPSFKSPKPPSFSAPPNPPPFFKVPKHPSFRSPSPKAAASPPPSSSAPSKSPYSSSMAPQPSSAPAGAASLPTTTSSSTKRGTLQPAVMAIAIAVASIALHALQF